MLCLNCCLFDLACFFLPSFSSLIKTCTCYSIHLRDYKCNFKEITVIISAEITGKLWICTAVSCRSSLRRQYLPVALVTTKTSAPSRDCPDPRPRPAHSGTPIPPPGVEPSHGGHWRFAWLVARGYGMLLRSVPVFRRSGTKCLQFRFCDLWTRRSSPATDTEFKL